MVKVWNELDQEFFFICWKCSDQDKVPSYCWRVIDKWQPIY